jgi:hypothetical protein
VSLEELFAGIEHIEFAARVQGAEDVDMFFSLTRPSREVVALLGAKEAPALVKRVQTLLNKRIDTKFMHPDDHAIAIYIDTLYRLNAHDAVRQAWGHCEGNDKLYWTNQVAQSINLREEAAKAAEAATAPAPTSTVSFAAPPEPVKLDDFVRVFYAEYTHASQSRARAAGQVPPPRPAWDQLPEDHPVRLVFTDTCKSIFTRLQAVVYVPDPPDEAEAQQALAQAIRSGAVAARVTFFQG